MDRKKIKNLILFCIVLIIFLIISVLVLRNKATEQHLNLTANMEQDVQIEYKGITKLDTITGDTLASTQLIKSLQKFLVEDLQYCINNVSVGDIEDYYSSNKKIFNRNEFNIPINSFRNIYEAFKNLDNEIKKSISECEIIQDKNGNLKLRLIYNENLTNKSIEASFNINDNNKIDIIF